MQNLTSFIGKHSNELKMMVYSIFIYLHIDTDVVNVLLILMAMDTLFGVRKSLVLGDVFKFSLLWFGIITKLLVLLIPMTLALVGKGLGYDFKPLVDIVMRVLVVAEGISILSSYYMIRTKKRIENIDVVTKLLLAVRNLLLKLMNFFIGKIESMPVEIDELNKDNNNENK
jgi:hypothetical protein